MSFIETVRRARALLSEEGRLSLRVLKREFDLEDEALEELVEELVDVQQVAALQGKIVSWVGPAAPDAESVEAARASGETGSLAARQSVAAGSDGGEVLASTSVNDRVSSRSRRKSNPISFAVP